MYFPQFFNLHYILILKYPHIDVPNVNEFLVKKKFKI
jgi:hypothetical protein